MRILARASGLVYAIPLVLALIMVDTWLASCDSLIANANVLVLAPCMAVADYLVLAPSLANTRSLAHAAEVVVAGPLVLARSLGYKSHVCWSARKRQIAPS